jgi:uncharacterized protein (TIGR02599 family)
MTNVRSSAPRAAFTLVELLVSTAIIGLLCTILVTALSQVGTLWQRAAGKSEQFRDSRNAFDSMTTRLGQATLDVHWEYDDPAKPTKYRRDSNLRFISGPAEKVLSTPPAGRERTTHCVFFQAPFGITENSAYRGYENLLCTAGYFIDVGDDAKLRPEFLKPEIVPLRVRPRLLELLHPTEMNQIYKLAKTPTFSGRDWFRNALADPPASPLKRVPTRPLAENIIALVLTPRLSPVDEAEVNTGDNPDFSPLAPDYLYDSSPVSKGSPGDSRHKDPRLNPAHQLPPMLQVTMVAVDETSMPRLGYASGQLDPLGLKTKFKKSADYSTDLLLVGGSDSLESELIALRANYRIFTTNVVIRGAKWSREQKEAF